MVATVFVRYEGRREQIRVESRHTPVHAIVGEACRRFGVTGAFALRSARARKGAANVDSAAAWAHAGLPNNADVDLVRVEAKTGTVRVACNADGRTLTTSADSSLSLADVVRPWLPDGARPVVRILRERFEGAALATSLGSLGYGPGSSVRIVLEVDRGREPAPEATTPMETPMERPPKATPEATTMEDAEPVEETKAAPKAPRTSAVDAAVAVVAASPEPTALAATLRKYAVGLQTSRDARVRRIALENAALRRVGAPGRLFLESLGFEERGDALEMVDEDSSLVAYAVRKLDGIGFDPFQSKRVDLKGQPRSGAESSIERQVRELKDKEAKMVEGPRPDRRAQLFVKPAAVVADDEPVTDDDVVVRRAAAKRAAERRAKDDGPLTTKAVRDLAALKKKKVFPHVVIKFAFPDGVTLRATFAVWETLQDARAFLADYVALDDYEIYTSPPRTPLVDNHAPLGVFAPAARLYLALPDAYLKPGITPDAQETAAPLPPSLPLANTPPANDDVEAPPPKRPSANNRAPKRGGFAWLKTG